MSELKPCPFCGSTELEIIHVKPFGESMSVHCTWCRADGPIGQGDIRAMISWNKRKVL